MTRSDRKPGEQPNACLKTVLLEDLCGHREKILQHVQQKFVDVLLKNQPDSNCLMKLQETNMILQECCLKLEKLVECAETNLVSKASNSSLTAACLRITLQEIWFGQPYSVELLCHGTPDRFWLQLANSSTTNLENNLKVHYSQKTPLAVRPAVGEFVVVLGSNKIYCRSKVVSIITNIGSSSVQFELVLVDYGDTIITSLDKIYPIEECFCSLPATGILCNIDGISCATECWGLEAVGFFLSMCDNLVATFHPFTGKKDPFGSFSIHQSDYSVTLVNNNPSGELIDIGWLLIEKGFAKELVPQANEKIQSAQYPVAERYASYQQTLAFSSPKFAEMHKSPSVGFNPSEVSKMTSPEPNFYDAVSNLSEHQSSSIKSSKVKKISFNVAAPEFYPNSSELPKTNPSEKPLPASSPYPKSTNVKDQQVLMKAVCSLRPFTLQSGINSNSSVRLPNSTSASLLRSNAAVEKSAQPSAVKYQLYASESETQEIDEPHRGGPDRQLMRRFFDSLGCAGSHEPPASQACAVDSPHSIVATPIHSSTQSRSLYGRFDAVHNFRNYVVLDYAFGAVLKSRPLEPFLTVSKLTFIPASIISPTHFYVYPIDEISSQLGLVEELLNDLYLHSNSVAVTKPEIGSCWVINHRIETWARVRVTGLDEDHQTVDVFFVDYGDADTVKTSHLHPLVKELLGIPCLAVRCRLFDICPKDQKNSEVWTETACLKFMDYLESRHFDAVVASPLGKNGELELVVCDANSTMETKTVNEYLVNIGEASFNVFLKDTPARDDKSPQTNHLKEPTNAIQQWNPMEEDFYSYKNNLTLNPENYDSVTVGYTPQDSKKICRFFLSKGRCPNGIRCSYLHQEPNKHMFTADEQEFPVDLPEEPLPTPGSMISVQVSCVNSPFSMYVVLPHGTRDLRYATEDVTEFETLETLQEAMQKEYAENFHQHRYSFPPVLTDIVVAKSSSDETWYRARVMAFDEEDCFVIFFLDFGNTEVIRLNNLCCLLPRFSHLPKQAFEVFLNGIEPDGSHSEEGKQQLVQLVEDKDLVAEVVSLRPNLSINLYDTNNSRHIDIAEELIASKLVKPGPKYPVKHVASINMLPG